MLTVAVLGASGFVGSRVVEKFHLGGVARVVPIVRNFAGLARPSRFDLDGRIADTLDLEALTTAFAGCDVVVNAVLGSYDQIIAQPPILYRAAEAAGVRRIVHVSTASVHGQDPEPGTDEASPLRDDQPVPYNNAKVRAEWQLNALRRNGCVELVMLRPGIVFGPRDIWVSGIVRRLVDGSAYLVDGGTGICNTIYIDNLVHAIELSLQAKVDRETFLVGDAETITWAELYRFVARALPGCAPPRILRDPPLAAERAGLLRRLRSHAAWRNAMARIPAPLKERAHARLGQLGSVIAAARAVRSGPRSEWVMPDAASETVPLETASLHRCRYKFPFAKARRLLGYAPLVSLEEGLMRTVRAQRLAGYPIDPDFAPRASAPAARAELRQETRDREIV
jgi:nucleoside-diphosphate-sugar epimerase